MRRLAWFGVMLAAAGGIGTRVARAQDDKFDVAEENRVYDMRDGKVSVREPAAQELIAKAARYTVMRIKSAAKPPPPTPTPMSLVIQKGARFVLEPSVRKISDSQKEYIQLFGKAMCSNIHDLMASSQDKRRNDSDAMLVRINGARMLAEVARSGYEGCLEVAVEIISNPKESDAVRLYAFRALKNLFAAVNPEDPARSFVTNAANEKKAIDALIAFISQKPSLAPNAEPEVVDGYRYVRREAVRALGSVRKPVLRENKKIVAAPALWLLRVASMDPLLSPAPSLSERVDALVGYLQLAPDTQENMDYAVWFVGLAIGDQVVEFLQFRNGNPSKVGDVPLPSEGHPWRGTANRMRAGLQDWKSIWEAENPSAPPAIAKMVADLVETANSQIFEHMAKAEPDNQRNAEGTGLEAFLKRQQYPNACLFKDDPTSVITPPKRER